MSAGPVSRFVNAVLQMFLDPEMILVPRWTSSTLERSTLDLADTVFLADAVFYPFSISGQVQVKLNVRQRSS